MAAEHVKVYEDGKKSGVPFWAWLIPLLILLALLGWFLSHRHAADTTAAPVAVAPAGTPSAATTGMPDLGSVHFDTDKATLTTDGQATLQQAAAYMKQNPAVHLRLEGYTDSTGTDPHNDTLSAQRAATVESFLMGQGIEKSRLTGQGFGPAAPVATNATTNGKADNRRVELFQQQ
ncbi:MAG: OmpA family protein [Janthinobacterium lividum]